MIKSSKMTRRQDSNTCLYNAMTQAYNKEQTNGQLDATVVKNRTAGLFNRRGIQGDTAIACPNFANRYGRNVVVISCNRGSQNLPQYLTIHNVQIYRANQNDRKETGWIAIRRMGSVRSGHFEPVYKRGQDRRTYLTNNQRAFVERLVTQSYQNAQLIKMSGQELEQKENDHIAQALQASLSSSQPEDDLAQALQASLTISAPVVSEHDFELQMAIALSASEQFSHDLKFAHELQAVEDRKFAQIMGDKEMAMQL